MNRLFLVGLALAIGGNCSAACNNVKLIGHYSNMEWTNDEDPHLVDGYSVSLYKCDTRVFGKISIAVGSPEAVSGQLYDVAFNRRSGKVIFKAKYSDGQEFSKDTGPQGREARTYLSFSGIVSPHALRGVVVLRDAYHGVTSAKAKQQVLKRSDDNDVPKSEEEFVKSRPFPTW